MTETKYAFQNLEKREVAKALGRNLSVSTKQSIEICRALRGKKLTAAKNFLNQVLLHKKAIPIKKNGGWRDGSHKKGMKQGGYFDKATKAILTLLESAENNAQSKGLNTGNLKIIHSCAHCANGPMRHGRHRGRQMKRTHVEIALAEDVVEKSKKSSSKKKSSVKNKEDVKKSSNSNKSDLTDKKDKKQDNKKEVKLEKKEEKKSETKTEKDEKKEDKLEEKKENKVSESDKNNVQEVNKK